MLTTSRPAGMRAFTLVWVSQLVSVLATNMTHFGLTIWIYQQTESVTALGLMQVFFITPFLVLSPIAGAMVDRYNRKLMMMISDLGGGLATLGLLALHAAGQLQLWHLYVAAVIFGLGNCFQWPAYSAVISTMVPKEHLGRANGMMTLMEAGPGVISPLLAGALLPVIGLAGIMTLDVVTFLLAIGVLLLVAIPQPPRTEEGRKAQGSLLSEAGFGFKYIFARPSLLGLQLVFFTGNLMSNMGYTVLPAMILARSGQNELVFGSVQTAGAVGAIIGGLLMSAWGGPKRRVHGVLAGWILGGLLGQTVVGLGRGLPVWALGMFLGGLVIPLVNASNQAIWQSKVPPDIQGRVFSARRLIAWFTAPIAPLIAGPLADRVLEPGMAAGGTLTSTFGWLVGIGPGAGMALLLAGTGLLASLAGLGGYLFPAVREAETRMPDAVPAAVEGATAAVISA